MKPSLRKHLFNAAGIICVALAALGIFLPLLPTTPFLLLAAACFARGSDSLYQWLLNHKALGPYIRNYREHRAIPLRAKIVTLAMLWPALGYSAFELVDPLPLRGMLMAIGAAVTIHILRFKTLR